MQKNKARRAVKVRIARPNVHGRKVKKKRHLDICAPVGDFSPVKPGQSFRSSK